MSSLPPSTLIRSKIASCADVFLCFSPSAYWSQRLPVSRSNSLFRIGSSASPFFPTDFRGTATPIEIHYDVKPSATSGEGPRLTLNVVPAAPGRFSTRTAALDARQRGVWKGHLPKGQVVLNVVYRSCVLANTLLITGNKAVIRLNYTFNGKHIVEEELYLGTTRYWAQQLRLTPVHVFLEQRHFHDLSKRCMRVVKLLNPDSGMECDSRSAG